MKIRMPIYNDVFAAHAEAASMAEYARIVWAETVAELEEADLVTKARLNMVDRYVRARTEWEFLYPIAMSEGPTRVADSGGEYANMKWSAVSKLNEQIMKLEQSLLLSPQSAKEKAASKPKEPKPSGADEFLRPATAH